MNKVDRIETYKNRRFSAVGLLRALDGVFLVFGFGALFLAVADLAEPIHPARLSVELATIVVAAIMFAWGRGE